MEMYKYMPLPSDRMGLLWTLASIEDACILEFGPAGTTHYAVEGIGSLNATEGAKVYSTHMEEKDVTFGKMDKLEKAIMELDENVAPKYIFVISSSIASIIGADVKATCDVLQSEVRAKLIPLEIGGFKGDYAKGVEEALLLIAKTFVKPVAQKRETYNLLGCNVDQFQFASDLNEVKRMMKAYFDKEIEAVFTAPSSIESLEKAAAARLNIVLRREALPAARWMEEKYGIPYVYKKPYGIAGTIELVNAIAKTSSWTLNQAVFNAEIAQLRSYCMQLKRKFFGYTGTKDCAIYADFDTTIGLKAMLEEFGLSVDKLQVIHQVKGETIETGYSEKERMLYLKERPLYLLLADEPTLKMKNQAKKAVQVSNPNLSTVLTFPYTPFVGVRGVLWMVQQIYNA